MPTTYRLLRMRRIVFAVTLFVCSIATSTVAAQLRLDAGPMWFFGARALDVTDRLQPRSAGAGAWYVHTTYDVDRGELFFVRPPGPVVRTRFGTLLPYARRQLPTYEPATLVA